MPLLLVQSMRMIKNSHCCVLLDYVLQSSLKGIFLSKMCPILAYDVNAMTSQMGGMQIGAGAPPSAQDNGGLYMLPQQGYYVNRKVSATNSVYFPVVEDWLRNFSYD